MILNPQLMSAGYREGIEDEEKSEEKSVRFSQSSRILSVPPKYTGTAGGTTPPPRSPSLANPLMTATLPASGPSGPELSGAMSYPSQSYDSVVMPGGFLSLHRPPPTGVTGQGIGLHASKQQSASSGFTAHGTQQHHVPPAPAETPTQMGQEASSSTARATPHPVAPHTQSLLSGFPSPSPFNPPNHFTSGFL